MCQEFSSHGEGACMAGGGHVWQGGLHVREGVHGRGHACQEGVHGRGHSWHGACMAGGMHGGGPASVAGGHAW